MKGMLYGCIPLYLLLLGGCQGASQQTLTTDVSRFVFSEPRELQLDLVEEIHPQNKWPVDVEMDRLIVLDETGVFVTGFNVSTTWRIDFSGDVLGSFGRRGQGPGEFQQFIRVVF